MTTTPNHLIAATIPDPSGVEPPAGFEACYWEDRPEYRVISGTSRGVAGRPSITVTPTALQLGDGLEFGLAVEHDNVVAVELCVSHGHVHDLGAAHALVYAHEHANTL